jgi:hypothetical protein
VNCPTHTINHRACCASTVLIGEPVTILEYAANRRSVKVKDTSGRRFWLPTCWLTEREKEPTT